MARIYPASDENIFFLGRKLLEGEIVAVPTETVYGLAACAFDEKACARVFQVKARPAFDPLIVHLPEDYELEEIASSNPLAAVLAAAFWPGPLTLVLPKKPVVPDIVTAGLGSVAVRVPRHPVFQKLLRECNSPLAAPSANPFSYVSPTTAAHVESGLGEKIDHILDGGSCEIGLESTIVDVRNPAKPSLLRPGAISPDELGRATGHWFGDPQAPGGEVMPGQLRRHYSPRSACKLRDSLDPHEALRQQETAFLFYRRPDPLPPRAENIFWLSETGDDGEAARRLFAVLREIDSRNFTRLLAERAPGHGLGQAINDRLRRAAATVE